MVLRDRLSSTFAGSPQRGQQIAVKKSVQAVGWVRGPIGGGGIRRERLHAISCYKYRTKAGEATANASRSRRLQRVARWKIGEGAAELLESLFAITTLAGIVDAVFAAGHSVPSDI